MTAVPAAEIAVDDVAEEVVAVVLLRGLGRGGGSSVEDVPARALGGAVVAVIKGRRNTGVQMQVSSRNRSCGKRSKEEREPSESQ